MGRRPSSPHHRILWPGELARLRDSRVLARSLRRARPPLPPPSSFSTSWPLRSPAAAAAWDGGVPCFLASGARGMRYPLRKKLAAARAFAFLPPPPEAVPEALVDAFAPPPPDVVTAAQSGDASVVRSAVLVVACL